MDNTFILYNNSFPCQLNMENLKIPKEKILKTWTFSEYTKHSRGVFWYVGALGISALLFLYSFKHDNFLFAIIIVMVLLIIFNSHNREPLKIKFSITNQGIWLNQKFYSYKDLNSFWIVYNPPKVKKLYFEKNNMLKTHLVVPLEDVPYLEVREILSSFLEEDLDKEGESLTEILGRALKL